MIKANELRIGNKLIGFDNKIFEWELGHFDLLWCGIPIEELVKSPIPITPEILKKCGFVMKEIGITNEFKNIKYLHELQNLVFVLIGEELDGMKTETKNLMQGLCEEKEDENNNHNRR